MHIYKAQWINHSGEAIYTIHVHPDGTRFATGGSGNDAQNNIQNVVHLFVGLNCAHLHCSSLQTTQYTYGL
jgi:hypothetical protein